MTDRDLLIAEILIEGIRAESARLRRERDEARAEVKRLRERELDDFTVTADELDAALDRAEKAEQERDDAREEAREWARQFNRRRAREALEGGDD